MAAPPIGPVQQVVSRRHAIGAPVPDGATTRAERTSGTWDEVEDVHRGDFP